MVTYIWISDFYLWNINYLLYLKINYFSILDSLPELKTAPSWEQRLEMVCLKQGEAKNVLGKTTTSIQLCIRIIWYYISYAIRTTLQTASSKLVLIRSFGSMKRISNRWNASRISQSARRHLSKLQRPTSGLNSDPTEIGTAWHEYPIRIAIVSLSCVIGLSLISILSIRSILKIH